MKEFLKTSKTFISYPDAHELYVAGNFEFCLRKMGKQYILFHYDEVNGEEYFIGVVDDVEDLKYTLEQAGGVWEDE